jgi:hypothetical protein
VQQKRGVRPFFVAATLTLHNLAMWHQASPKQALSQELHPAKFFLFLHHCGAEILSTKSVDNSVYESLAKPWNPQKTVAITD